MTSLAIRPDMTVDLRTLAEGCQTEYRSAFRLLKKNLAYMEETFGRVRFEITPTKSAVKGGDGQKLAYLTEDQATFFVALSQNTRPVVQFKAALVKAFGDAKRKLAQNSMPAEQMKEWAIADYFRRNRPIHDLGTPAKDGRIRVGYRGPTYTVTPGRLQDATMIAADRFILENPEFPGFGLEETK